MSHSDRLPAFPSRGTQMAMKARLRGAQNGHSLLKKKTDALRMRIAAIATKIGETKLFMGDVMKEAAFSLSKAKFVMGEFYGDILQNVVKAQITVRSKKENVAGVVFPVFDISEGGKDPYELNGLARGGQQLAVVKAVYHKAIIMLIELASLQTSFVTIEDVLVITRRRANAIDLVIIPKIERTISYIVSELDERDREDFYRMKKIQNNKRIIIRKAKEKLEAQLRLDGEKY